MSDVSEVDPRSVPRSPPVPSALFRGVSLWGCGFPGSSESVKSCPRILARAKPATQKDLQTCAHGAQKFGRKTLKTEIWHQMKDDPKNHRHGNDDHRIPSPVRHCRRGSLGRPTTKISNIGISCTYQSTDGEPIERIQQAEGEFLADHGKCADSQNSVPREHPERGNETTRK